MSVENKIVNGIGVVTYGIAPQNGSYVTTGLDKPLYICNDMSQPLGIATIISYAGILPSLRLDDVQNRNKQDYRRSLQVAGIILLHTQFVMRAAIPSIANLTYGEFVDCFRPIMFVLTEGKQIQLPQKPIDFQGEIIPNNAPRIYNVKYQDERILESHPTNALLSEGLNAVSWSNFNRVIPEFDVVLATDYTPGGSYAAKQLQESPVRHRIELPDNNSRKN